MDLKPGSRWKSAVCDTEVVVVRAVKEPAQLDGWLREGSAEYVAGLGEWE